MGTSGLPGDDDVLGCDARAHEPIVGNLGIIDLRRVRVFWIHAIVDAEHAQTRCQGNLHAKIARCSRRAGKPAAAVDVVEHLAIDGLGRGEPPRGNGPCHHLFAGHVFRGGICFQVVLALVRATHVDGLQEHFRDQLQVPVRDVTIDGIEVHHAQIICFFRCS